MTSSSLKNTLLIFAFAVVLMSVGAYWYGSSGALSRTIDNEEKMRLFLKELDYLSEDIMELSKAVDALIVKRLDERGFGGMSLKEAYEKQEEINRLKALK